MLKANGKISRRCSAIKPSVLSLLWPLQILGLTIAYFVAGKLSLSLAIPPVYATAIWPPSGIALAGILLYGNRVWPGIFLGALLINLSSSLFISPPAENLTSLIITGVISSGASLQGVAGAYLVRRFAGFPNSLASKKQVFLFLLFGGLLSTLVNSTLAVSILAIIGKIPTANYLVNWETWWLGDILGIFIFTPLVLVWLQQPNEPWHSRRIEITLPIIVMFALTTATVFYESQNNRERLKLEFDQRAVGLKQALETSILAHINVLRSLESFYSASATIDREQFLNFVTHALNYSTGIQALSWNPVIQSSERNLFEKSLQEEGYLNPHITEKNTAKQTLIAKNRPVYVPIRFIEPYKGNESALGYDMYSNALRHEAIDRAIDSGEITTTARVTLVQGNGAQYGVLVFLPIYRKGFPYQTVEDRRRNISGYMVAVCRGGDIVTAALKNFNREGLSYRLLDQSAPIAKQLIFSSDRQQLQPAILQQNGLFGSNLTLASSFILPVGGRSWRFEVSPTQDYFSTHNSSNAGLIFLTGLILTSMVVIFTMVSSGRRSLLRKLVKKHTAKLEQVLSSATGISIVSTDAQGLFTTFNRGAELMLGYSSEEMIGKQTPCLIHATEEIMQRGRELTLELGRPVTGFEVFVEKINQMGIEKREWTYVRKDQSTLTVSLTVTITLNQNGEISGYLGIAEDISERKKNEALILLAKDQAQDLARSKSAFIANMSHEIRTPMNAIIGLSYLALNKKISTEARNYLEKINSSANNLLGILNDILDFSRLEAEHLTIEHSAFDLDVILDNLCNLFTDSALVKHLDFNIAVAPDVPRGLIGDMLRLQQILINLLGNALKFTEQGSVTLTITLQQLNHSQARLLFCITDTGIGIAAHDLDKLFQPFRQVDDSITRRYGGSGLGLAISHNLLQLMGGEFSVTSAPGNGTSFDFELVMGVSSLSSPHTSEATPLAQVDLEKLLAGTRILVAEDNLINQQVAEEFLTLLGITVKMANNGKEALALLEQGQFDAVLMDLHMPILDGFEATKLIRSQARFTELPIIALTASVTQEEQSLYLASGMNDFIAKPIHPEDLLLTLVRWIKPGATGAAEARDQKLSSAESLPVLDLDNLLLMLGNNEALMIRLLLSFIENMKDAPGKIVTMITAGNIASAKELLHKIKGASGNIGALKLHAAAETLESELNEELAAGTLTAFNEVFNQTMSAIAKLSLSKEPLTSTGGNSEKLKRYAAELDLLLIRNDYISDALLNALKPHLALDQLDWFTQLRRLVNNFQYVEARKTLREVTEV